VDLDGQRPTVGKWRGVTLIRSGRVEIYDQPTPMPWCGGRKLVIQFA
jgi:hypothetical protein